MPNLVYKILQIEISTHSLLFRTISDLDSVASHSEESGSMTSR
jgi:hypothetical protein